MLAVLLVPLGLALLASFLGKYPYCGLRVLAFMTPAICLLTAAGISPLLAWLRERSSVCVWVLYLALAIPFVHTAWRVTSPWQRADTSASAEFVLNQWQPGDGVGFNHWEGEYYFRRQSASWFHFEEPASAAWTRLWFVAVAAEPAQREELLRAVPVDWRPVERREFTGASVVRFARALATDDSTSAVLRIP